jgi:hypothetical protein
MTSRDDLFTIFGETWFRTWSGDRYDWTSSDGRLVCWRDVRQYRATLDGYPSTKTWPTLTAAMVASVQSREKYDRRAA